MTALQIQSINLFIIIIDIVLVLIAGAKYKKFWLWFVPVGLLLLNSLIFGIVLYVDTLDSIIINKTLYNVWSALLQSQSNSTIGVYCIAAIFKYIDDNNIEINIKKIFFPKKGG
jgi:hypothetical protein